MVGRGIRWHRRRNRAQLGGLTAFLPPAFGPLSCLLGARHMTAVPLVIVPPQRVLDGGTSSRRTAASADDLPLDGPPSKACHSTSGSDQDGVTSAATPAPHTPATAARRAWAT